jgi:hypothetical protein
MPDKNGRDLSLGQCPRTPEHRSSLWTRSRYRNRFLFRRGAVLRVPSLPRTCW